VVYLLYSVLTRGDVLSANPLIKIKNKKRTLSFWLDQKSFCSSVPNFCPFTSVAFFLWCFSYSVPMEISAAADCGSACSLKSLYIYPIVIPRLQYIAAGVDTSVVSPVTFLLSLVFLFGSSRLHVLGLR
jgi:hypothetical protein